MKGEAVSRRALYVAVAVASLWCAWALVYEATGLPGLNYLAFGFISVPVGLALFTAAAFGYTRSRKQRRATGYAVAAMCISVGVALVPFAALLELADYS